VITTVHERFHIAPWEKTTLIDREKYVFAHEGLRITHGDDEGDHAWPCAELLPPPLKLKPRN
jgi:hypothetical protein